MNHLFRSTIEDKIFTIFIVFNDEYLENHIIFRTLSETVNTLKDQIIDLQSQMVLLTRQLDEERKSRLSLAATVKRSIAVMDASVS